MPFPDFLASAECLDNRRLGKQRVETLQILQVFGIPQIRSRWSNHPAVRMWRGYPFGLGAYGRAICDVWMERGYRDTCYDKINKVLRYGVFDVIDLSALVPPWLGDKRFHISHQSNLVRKDPIHYRRYFLDVPNNLPYVWPE